jgi:hypothetical protein
MFTFSILFNIISQSNSFIKQQHINFISINYNYPAKAVITKVTAGTVLDIALAIEEEARYNPSKYRF